MSSEKGFLFEKIKKIRKNVFWLKKSDEELDIKLDLPQIVVIGSQSHGKSSVLESIVGEDFLPKGNGMVTKAPLILDIQHKENFSEDVMSHFNNGKKIIYGTFGDDKKNEIYYDFEKIKSKIEEKTKELTNDKKTVCDDPINLNFFSNYLTDLTLIDLPGLIANSNEKTLPKRIENLAKKYIKNENSFILCVYQSGDDIDNSMGLKIAKEIDKDFKRTMVVLTKVDKVTDEKEILKFKKGIENDINPKLGYVPVINFSVFKNEGLSDEEVEEKKKILKIFGDKVGTEYLVERLSNLLFKKTKEQIPEIKKYIKDKLEEQKKELDKLGESFDGEKQYKIILDTVDHLKKFFFSSIEGGNDLSEEIELYGGIEIRKIHTSLKKKMPKFENQKVDGEKIKSKLENGISSKILDEGNHVIKKEFKNYLENIKEKPVYECLNDVRKILDQVLEESVKKTLQRFPSLQEDIIETMKNMFDVYQKKTKNFLNDLIEIEKIIFFFEKPKIDGDNNVEKVINAVEKLYEKAKEKLSESIPKAINHFLVNQSTNNFGIILEEFKKPEKWKEDEGMLKQREKYNKKIIVFQQILKEVAH